MTVLDELPFSFVEREGFRHFCSIASPKFDLPSRTTIARDINQLYLDEKVVLKSMFSFNKKRVCVTTYCWTSIQNTNYMVVTAHFFNSGWELHKRILNFCVLPNHKGETIGKIIEACLLDWSIDRVFTITVDNASANDVAIKYVKNKLSNWVADGIILECEFFYVRCCAHILNPIVTEGLKDLRESIISIRNGVRYVRSSPSRLYKIKKCDEHEKIECKGNVILDVCTRWNFTYLMLGSDLKFQKAFERLEEKDGNYVSYFLEDESGKRKMGPPRFDDWETSRVFVKFLKKFYDATLKFSASLSVTSNQYFQEVFSIQSELIELSTNTDHFLGIMATSMKRNYDKYWGSIESINKLLLISIVLDPRYKLDYVTFYFGYLYGNDKGEGMTKGFQYIGCEDFKQALGS
ncbi:hypothetical protein Ddye_028506 [Dipteronia dyeriana]|uniref:hAT-like transposase RNase-H fold domain-containing protein n=1 Tax=Dipteronia dyeriana TaxID=168575 RepID=A0AAD9TCP6_9ROSI|nr:hypothetical protein Ddye_028506 [Dipteronia dyeriana]